MLVEINPLIVTPDGELRALDAKYTVDDNALFRHPDIAEMRDLEALPPEERMARERGVTYVKLDGTIGIIGNGAGLVMSTLDVVAGAGGKPANFLDVGGGAQADEIVTAMEVLLSDPKVRAVLFNVFGGITRCDEVARGILTALERLDVDGADGRAAGRDERRRGPRSSWPTPRRPTCTSRRRCSARPSASSSWRGAPPDGDPRRTPTPGSSSRASPAARAAFHTLRNRDYGTNVVAGVTPGKGGQDVERHPGLRHRRTTPCAERGRQHGDGVRAAAVRRRRDLRGGRRRRRDGRLHHRGHPRPRHARLYNHVAPARDRRCSGPTAPARSRPGVANVGIIPAQVFAQGRHRPGLALGHAHVPDRQGAGRRSASATRPSSASAATRSSASASSTPSTLFEADPETDLVVMVGEIGGDEEEKAAAYIGEHMRDAGRRLHRRLPGAARARRWATPARSSRASSGTAQAKKEALEARGRPRRPQPDRGGAARRRGVRQARLSGRRPPAHPVGWIACPTRSRSPAASRPPT